MTAKLGDRVADLLERYTKKEDRQIFILQIKFICNIVSEAVVGAGSGYPILGQADTEEPFTIKGTKLRVPKNLESFTDNSIVGVILSMAEDLQFTLKQTTEIENVPKYSGKKAGFWETFYYELTSESPLK